MLEFPIRTTRSRSFFGKEGVLFRKIRRRRRGQGRDLALDPGVPNKQGKSEPREDASDARGGQRQSQRRHSNQNCRSRSIDRLPRPA